MDLCSLFLLLFSAQAPDTGATHEARLAAEEPRCQALDWTSVRFVAGPIPGICPGFAAAFARLQSWAQD